jgi:hypothetical protein
LVKLKSSLRKIYGRHHDFVNRYGIYVSQMTSFMVYHRVCSMNSTTGATSGAGTAYPSGTLEFTPVFSGVSVARSLVSCIVFCLLLFVSLVVNTSRSFSHSQLITGL